MPITNNATVVSAAGDMEIRVHDMHTSTTLNSSYTSSCTRVYRCHTDRVKRLLSEENPFTFISCAEDGQVRAFDLRQPMHACRKRDVFRGIMTRDGDVGCDEALLNYGPYRIDLNGVARTPLRPWYLAVGGQSPYVYLHDRRMIRPYSVGNGNAGCVHRFLPQGHPAQQGHVTAVRFAPSSPSELIASWSNDYIYLFDINATYPKPSHTFASRSIRKSISASHPTLSSLGDHQSGSSAASGQEWNISITGELDDSGRIRIVNFSSDPHSNRPPSQQQPTPQQPTPQQPILQQPTLQPSHPQEESPELRIQRLFDTSLVAYRTADYDLAIRSLTDIVLLQNQSIQIRSNTDTSLSWTEQREFDEARSHILRNRALCRLHCVDHVHSAGALASADAARSTALNPTNPKTWWIRAVCQWKHGMRYLQHPDHQDIDKSQRCFKDAIEFAQKARERCDMDADMDGLGEKARRFLAETQHRIDHPSSPSLEVECACFVVTLLFIPYFIDVDWLEQEELENVLHPGNQYVTQIVSSVHDGHSRGLSSSSSSSEHWSDTHSEDSVDVDDNERQLEFLDDNSGDSDDDGQGWLRGPKIDVNCHADASISHERLSFKGHCNVQVPITIVI